MGDTLPKRLESGEKLLCGIEYIDVISTWNAVNDVLKRQAQKSVAYAYLAAGKKIRSRNSIAIGSTHGSDIEDKPRSAA